MTVKKTNIIIATIDATMIEVEKMVNFITTVCFPLEESIWRE
jgi:hypothetical protein